MAWNFSDPKYLLPSGWTALRHLRIHLWMKHYSTYRGKPGQCVSLHCLIRDTLGQTQLCGSVLEVSHDYYKQSSVWISLALVNQNAPKSYPCLRRTYLTSSLEGGWEVTFPQTVKCSPWMMPSFLGQGENGETCVTRSPSCPFLSGSPRMGLS